MKVYDLDKAKEMLRRTINNLDKMILQHDKLEVESKILVHKDGKLVFSGKDIKEVAEKLDIHYVTVSHCTTGVKKQAKGYTFERLYYRKEVVDAD